MTAAIASTLRKTLASAAIAAATVLADAGTAFAAVYEYSFSALVDNAETYYPLGNSSLGAFGLGVGSAITGRLWVDSGAQFDSDLGGTYGFYSVDGLGLTIDGLALPASPSGAAGYYTVINTTEAPGWDALQHGSSVTLPNGSLNVGWYIAAPVNWIDSTAVPLGLPVSDLLLQNSWGTLLTSGNQGNESLRFRFTSISPVPEPSTYALMLAGLVLVGGIAARRQSDQGN